MVTAKDFQPWTDATAELPWGAQRALHSTLELVRDEKLHLTYGADYSSDGTPCLINAASNMLSAVGGEGGSGKPSAAFSEIVSNFDRINRLLFDHNVNLEHGVVSPLAAEFLLHNFAPLKDKPVDVAVDEVLINEAFAEGIYVEPSDEEFTREWLNSLATDPAIESKNDGPTEKSRQAEVSEPVSETEVSVSNREATK